MNNTPIWVHIDVAAAAAKPDVLSARIYFRNTQNGLPRSARTLFSQYKVYTAAAAVRSHFGGPCDSLGSCARTLLSPVCVTLIHPATGD